MAGLPGFTAIWFACMDRASTTITISDLRARTLSHLGRLSLISAKRLPGYADVRERDKPEGVDSVIIDTDTWTVETRIAP